MIVLRWVLAAAFLWLAALASSAQDAPDYAAWEALANRAEAAVAIGEASNAAFQDLRDELDTARSTFLAAQGLNSARLETLRAQLEALGPAPTEGEAEAEGIAELRETLGTQIAELSAPSLRAGEAFRRANGIISEIDTIIRERRAARLFARGPTILDVTIWTSAAAALNSSAFLLSNGMQRAVENGTAQQAISENLPLITVLLVVALAFVARGRRWLEAVGERLSARDKGAGLRLSAFLISLGQIVVPVIGLIALTRALILTGLVAFWGERLVAFIPAIGVALFVARWLAVRLFPRAEGASSPFNVPREMHRSARVTILLTGVTVAAFGLVELLAATDRYNQDARVALLMPITILGSYLVFRLGRILAAHAPDVDEEGAPQRTVLDRLIGVLSRLARIIGLMIPLVAVTGYVNAAEALVFPAIISLALFAVLLQLMEVARDIYLLITRKPSADESLIPVLTSALLFLVSLPLLALIWGATLNDLGEMWIRIQEGVTLGETRISPTSFFVLIIVFALGYTLTRFVQSALRSSVLPKTRLDIGGQTAITSGLGYLGIFIAALLAISAAGIDLTSFAFIAGTLGVGIGFGLQNIVSNFISGIILLVERPISEGDWIEVGGQMGYVRDISVRYTRIETFDRTDVIIPNADLISGTVTNYTRGNSVGRVLVPVGVAYGTDTGRVSEILSEIARAHPMVALNPPPNVFFLGFGADSLDFEIRAILRDVNWMMVVKSEMNHAIAKRFTEEGIEIPFAQRDVWLRNPEVLSPPAPPAPASDTAETAGNAKNTDN